MGLIPILLVLVVVGVVLWLVNSMIPMDAKIKTVLNVVVLLVVLMWLLSAFGLISAPNVHLR